MRLNFSRQIAWVGAAGAVVAGLVAASHVRAAPNLYSESKQSTASRLTVTAPTSGTYKPGDQLTISWTKTTPENDLKVTLYSATTSGLRDKKVRDITPASRAGWSSRGGSFGWDIPEGLPKGRYLIAVQSKLDVATSQPFAVTEEENEKLGPSKLGSSGLVKKVDVSSLGAAGTAVIETGSDTTYEWGNGKCAALGGGLPGAFAAMAALRATVQPRFREVTDKSGSVVQRCLDGVVVVAPPAASALAAAD